MRRHLLAGLLTTVLGVSQESARTDADTIFDALKGRGLGSVAKTRNGVIGFSSMTVSNEFAKYSNAGDTFGTDEILKSGTAVRLPISTPVRVLSIHNREYIMTYLRLVHTRAAIHKTNYENVILRTLKTECLMSKRIAKDCDTASGIVADALAEVLSLETRVLEGDHKGKILIFRFGDVEPEKTPAPGQP